MPILELFQALQWGLGVPMYTNRLKKSINAFKSYHDKTLGEQRRAAEMAAEPIKS